MNEKLYESHIFNQLSLLESLCKEMNPVDVAKDAMSLILSTYGSPKPHGAELDIAVNDVCNLKCRHCYYASTHLNDQKNSSDLLSEEQWSLVVKSAIQAGLTHVAIVGKEPLIPRYSNLTFVILDELKREKEINPNIRFDLTTNGTYIEQYLHKLKDISNFDSFTISFDGTKDYHDYIRGKGMYHRSRRGLELISEAGINNRNISTTVMPNNVHTLDVMAKELVDYGAETITFNICFSTRYNQQDLSSTREVFNRLMEKIMDLPNNLESNIILRGDVHAGLIVDLYKSNFFQNYPIASSKDLAPAIFTILSNDPIRVIQTSFLPLALYGGFRLNSNGDAVDFCASFEKHPKIFGNVKTNSIKGIYDFAREKLWIPYTELYFMRLFQAFQGVELDLLSSRIL